MTLIKVIREKVKSGASVPAVVLDVFYGRASVRLSSNGSILHNLEVVGGPVIEGQAVKVDFTTPEPTVVAISQDGLSAADVLDLINANKDPGSTGGFDWQILVFADGLLGGIYPGTSEGLQEALAGSGYGVNVYIPACEISGDFTIPIGATLQGMGKELSILNGTITLSEGASIESLYLKGQVQGPTSEFASMRHCRIYSSYGPAVYGNAGKLVIHQSLIQGSTYAVSSAFQVYLYHCGVWGPTDWFTGSGSVFTFSVTDVPPDDLEMVVWKNQMALMRSANNQLWMGYIIEPDYITPDPSSIEEILASKAYGLVKDGNYLYINKSVTYGYQISRYDLTTEEWEDSGEEEPHTSPMWVYLEDEQFIYEGQGEWQADDPMEWYSDILIQNFDGSGKRELLRVPYYHPDYDWETYGGASWLWHIVVANGKLIVINSHEFDAEDFLGEEYHNMLYRIFRTWIVDIASGILEKVDDYEFASNQWIQYPVSPHIVNGKMAYITYHFDDSPTGTPSLVNDRPLVFEIDVDALTINARRGGYQGGNTAGMLFCGDRDPDSGDIVWVYTCIYDSTWLTGICRFNTSSKTFSFEAMRDGDNDDRIYNMLRSEDHLYPVAKSGKVYLLGSYTTPVQTLNLTEQDPWFDEPNPDSLSNVVTKDGSIWNVESAGGTSTGTLKKYPIAGGSASSVLSGITMPTLDAYSRQWLYIIDGMIFIQNNKEQVGKPYALYMLE